MTKSSRQKGKIKEAEKTSPKIKLGTSLVKSGIVLAGSSFIVKAMIKTKTNEFMLFIDNSGSTITIIISILLVIAGLGLIIVGFSDLKKNNALIPFYYIIGLHNQTPNIPNNALPHIAQWYPPNYITFKIEGISIKEKYKDLIFIQESIQKRIDQNISNIAYFAGLAPIPLLFSIGYSFRNAYSSIQLIEHSHKSTKWFLLKQVDDIDVNLIIENNIKNSSDNEDVAVLISFSCIIDKKEIPNNLQKNLIKISLNKGVMLNQIDCNMAIQRIVDEIMGLLTNLNKKFNQIHLFISAQSSVVYTLGRRYHEGMTGNIQVYNYDASVKKYTWSIALNNGNQKLIP